MGKVSLIILSAICLASCKQSPVTSALSNSDSVVVQFFSEKEVLQNAAITTEKDAIRKLAGFIGTGYQDSVHCKKAGRMIFYESGKELQRVLWKTECRQFEFMLDGKNRFTGMSKEAYNFITDITPTHH